MDAKIYSARPKTLRHWIVVEEIVYDDGHRSKPEQVASFEGVGAQREAEAKAEELNTNGS